MNRLRFERRISFPFSAVIEWSERYFSERARGVLRVPLRIGPLRLPLRQMMTTGIIVAADATDDARKHEALEISLRPLGRVPFPEMHAVLTVRPKLPPGTHLTLELTYQPPLGLPGRALDALAGRRVAGAIGEGLMDDLCVYLGGCAAEPDGSQMPQPAP